MGRIYSIEAYNAAGADLDTSDLDFGPTINAALSQYKSMLLFVRVVPDAAGTGLTGITATVEARAGDSDAWQEVESIDMNTGTQTAEQTYTSMPSGTDAVNYGPLNIDATGMPQVRIGIKSAGSPKAGDRVVVTAQSEQADLGIR